MPEFWEQARYKMNEFAREDMPLITLIVSAGVTT